MFYFWFPDPVFSFPQHFGFGSLIPNMEETYSKYFLLLLENKLSYLHVTFWQDFYCVEKDSLFR